MSHTCETIELQQQVARLRAVLEASRQIHSTIREDEVLDYTLRIVIRELELAGAAFPDLGRAYGNMPLNNHGMAKHTYLLQDRKGNRMTELVVTAPGGRDLTFYEADFLECLALQAAFALENARNLQSIQRGNSDLRRVSNMNLKWTSAVASLRCS